MLTFQTLGNVSINQKILCRSFFCLIAITKLETKAPPESKFAFFSKNQAFSIIDFILTAKPPQTFILHPSAHSAVVWCDRSKLGFLLHSS